MKTKNGIELNLKESEYKAYYDSYIFYFSSELYMNNFINKLEDYITLEEARHQIKYGFKLDIGLYLAFSLYRQIEKRGFYVEDSIIDKEVPKEIEFEAIMDVGDE